MPSSASEPIVAAPAPWKLKGTIYSFMLYVTAKDATALQDDRSFLYSPLEAKSAFSDGKLTGGLAMVQVIRYTESPVGPYDEIIIVPGKYEYEIDTTGSNGEVKRERKRNLKVTRIYVSQEKTCWNGRNNWNIPKHLAEFDFKPLANDAVTISVYPLERSSTGSDWTKSKIPFFSATYKPIRYVPSFPMSTSVAKYVGLDLALVQPPLPESKECLKGELVGTKQWSKVIPFESSKKASLGWWDLKRGPSTEEDALLGSERQPSGGSESEGDNWWPGLGRWQIGLRMENATIEFPQGKRWHGPEG